MVDTHEEKMLSFMRLSVLWSRLAAAHTHTGVVASIPTVMTATNRIKKGSSGRAEKLDAIK